MSKQFDLDDMKRFAIEAWGPFGAAVVDKWAHFNDLYFNGVLRPVPLVITHTQPYGNSLAFCSYNPGSHGRTITLNVPKKPGTHGIHYSQLADNNSLLHEMIHQKLFEAGRDASHKGSPWRHEIMRLNEMIAGAEIWAGQSNVVRDKEQKKNVRINLPKDDGTPSLTQGEIASWPHSASGINLGKLGAHL